MIPGKCKYDFKIISKICNFIFKKSQDCVPFLLVLYMPVTKFARMRKENLQEEKIKQKLHSY